MRERHPAAHDVVIVGAGPVACSLPASWSRRSPGAGAGGCQKPALAVLAASVRDARSFRRPRSRPSIAVGMWSRPDNQSSIKIQARPCMLASGSSAGWTAGVAVDVRCVCLPVVSVLAGLCVASTLLLSACGDLPSDALLGSTSSDVEPDRSGSERCAPTSVSVPLLGMAGDSPILPVQVLGRPAAMFFSPGFGPLLFRDNGSVSFGKYRRVDIRQQDNDVISASTSVGWGLSVGNLKPADRPGYLLPEPDDRSVDGRPVVGMLGRDILSKNAVVNLDLPGRRVTFSATAVGCPSSPRPPPVRSIEMQQEVLLVTVKIDGRPVQAILEPDLAVSILPRKIAEEVGLADADLANDPSVVTRFGRGVLGRRHRVRTLDVGDVRLQHVAFDVEDDVTYAMLGLNFFDLGRATFDFANSRFLFRQTTTILPAQTNMHFDQTKVAHVKIGQ